MHPATEVFVDSKRIWEELEHLGGLSSTEAPSVTRILFTETDLKGRAYVRELMLEAGLTVIEDAVGNITGRWLGEIEDLARIGSGSHCDAIPHAGRFDGTVGVLGGIEAVRALRAAGFKPKRSIDIIMFTSEEPTRFGIGCCGSRLLGGALGPSSLAELKDSDGISFDQARTSAGYTGPLASVPLKGNEYKAFVELHVEQGPVLEAESLDIGVVTAIAAPASLELTFEGSGGHAGTVLMGDRRDALIPPAILAAHAEELAVNSDSKDTVATVGILEVYPGAVNSIPRKVRMTIDIRDTQLKTRDAVVRKIEERAEVLASERDLKLEMRTINSDEPAFANNELIAAIEDAACEFKSRRMVSRAYHDALFMAKVAPMGMIFVPSKGGISHRPEEYTSPDEIKQGVMVLAKTLAKLAC